MQPNLHPHKKADWARLHVDGDLDRFLGNMHKHGAPDPEPVLSDI